MPIKVITPDNLGNDFSFHAVEKKITNDAIVIAPTSPTVPPPEEKKSWLYVTGDVTSGFTVDSIWDPTVGSWGAVQGGGSGGSTPTLAEISPGRLEFTDTTATTNLVDISGLRDTGQTDYRVEVDGNIIHVLPNGTAERVTISDTETSIDYVGAFANPKIYSGDSVFGSIGSYIASNGTALTASSSATLTGPDQSRVVSVAAESDYSSSALYLATRDHSTDLSNINIMASKANGDLVMHNLYSDGTSDISRSRIFATSASNNLSASADIGVDSTFQKSDFNMQTVGDIIVANEGVSENTSHFGLHTLSVTSTTSPLSAATTHRIDDPFKDISASTTLEGDNLIISRWGGSASATTHMASFYQSLYSPVAGNASLFDNRSVILNDHYVTGTLNVDSGDGIYFSQSHETSGTSRSTHYSLSTSAASSSSPIGAHEYTANYYIGSSDGFSQQSFGTQSSVTQHTTIFSSATSATANEIGMSVNRTTDNEYGYIGTSNGYPDTICTMESHDIATGAYSSVQTIGAASGNVTKLVATDGSAIAQISVSPGKVDIGAGDTVYNIPTGADGDVLVRYGGQTEVRFLASPSFPYNIDIHNAWPATIASNATYVRVYIDASSGPVNATGLPIPTNCRPGTRFSLFKTDVSANPITGTDNSVSVSSGTTQGSYMNLIFTGTDWLIESRG